MYLLVFVLLMLSILGVYTEIYIVQASRLSANQIGVAQAMLDWHGAAVRLVGANSSSIGGSGADGCLLTPVQACASGVTACTPQLTQNSSYLPSGYNYSAYEWCSILYTPNVPVGNKTRYVVTYVSTPASAPSQPGGRGTVDSSKPVQSPDPTVGYTVGEIYQQLMKTGLVSSASLSAVDSGGTLTLTASGCTAANCPNFLAPTGMPQGSVAIISAQ